MTNPNNDVYVNGRVARKKDEPMTSDDDREAESEPSGECGNRFDHGLTKNKFKAADAGFSNNGAKIDAKPSCKVENKTKVLKSCATQTENDHDHLDNIVPFLYPEADSSKKLLVIEVFKMVERRKFNKRYSRSKLGKHSD